MRTFRDFMERALYDPDRGYYARRKTRADFYTAPELHAAFGSVISRRIEDLSHRFNLDPARIFEMGAGEGVLAEQILTSLPDAHYSVIERSGPAREAARARLSQFDVEFHSTLDELAPGRGIFLSNELVDAFPVHVLEMSEGRVRELYVRDDGSQVLGELSTPALSAHADKVAASLQEGERHAVNLEAERWLSRVAGILTAGAVITIDYGSRFHGQPNPPRAFYKHSQPSGLTDRAGEQDLTASVDFESLIEAGKKLGMKTEFYGSLSRFLIDGGIADFLPTGQSAADVKSRSQVKTLLHPDGMGEVFKVLVQTVGEGMLS